MTGRGVLDRLTSPWIVIPVGMLLSAGLGVFLLGDKNLWLDEATSWYFSGPFIQRLPDLPDVNMNLYYWLLALWRQVTGSDAEASLRALSVIFAVLSVPLAWGVAQRLLGTRAAAIATLLIAVDVIAVRFSQEVRGYSLLLFLALATTLLFLNAWRNRALVSWLVYGIVAAVSLYAHFFAGFVIATHFLIFIAYERRGALAMRPVAAYSIFALGAAPLLAAIQIRGGCQVAWIPDPDLGFFASEVRDVGGWPAVALLAAYTLLGAVAAIGALRSRDPRRRGTLLLLGTWVMLPVVGALVLSAVQPIFVLRYLVVALPPLVLVATAGVMAIRRRQIAVVAVLVLVIVNGAALATWYARPSSENWEPVAEYVTAGARSADGIMFYTRSLRKPFGYYVGRLGRIPQAPVAVWTPKAPCEGEDPAYEAELASIALAVPAQHERVWIIMGHTELLNPSPDLVMLLNDLDRNYRLAERATFGANPESSHFVEVRLYERRAGVAGAPTP